MNFIAIDSSLHKLESVSISFCFFSFDLNIPDHTHVNNLTLMHFEESVTTNRLKLLRHIAWVCLARINTNKISYKSILFVAASVKWKYSVWKQPYTMSHASWWLKRMDSVVWMNNLSLMESFFYWMKLKSNQIHRKHTHTQIHIHLLPNFRVNHFRSCQSIIDWYACASQCQSVRV